MQEPEADRDTEETFEFDCPDCGFHIVGEVDRCPKCGVEFVIEEVPDEGAEEASEEQGEAVERLVDAPESDARSAELKEEFARLVDEVGPLLTLATGRGVEVSAPRLLIDKAVSAGKRRDLVEAVAIMRDCRGQLEKAIAVRLDRDIMQLENLVDVAAKIGSDVTSLRTMIADAKAKRDEGDVEGAFREADDGGRMAEKLTGRYVEAHQLYEALERAVLNAERFYLDVREIRKLLNEARDAQEQADWTTMSILARKGRDELNRMLPPILKEELRLAKQALIEAKASGRDVTSMIKILKNAGMAARRQKYEEALDLLNDFRDEESAK